MFLKLVISQILLVWVLHIEMFSKPKSTVYLYNSMKFDHQNLGHGSYMISSNGHCWSHSKKEENMV